MGEDNMSNYEYDDEYDDDNVSPQVDNDLVKQLRKANKQKEKELADLKSQFDNLSKAQRERAVKDVLSARGVNSKVASFIPTDIDPTEESVSKWLEENADVFGIQMPQETQQKPNVDPAQAAAYQRMTQTVDQGFTPDRSDDIMARLMNANSRDELDQVIRDSGL
jgi:hypothetical protein